MAIMNKDVEKLMDVFATKKDLIEFKDEVVNKLDKISGELERAR